MRNFKKWSFILAAFLIVFLGACKQSATGSFIGSDKKPLTISIASNDNIKLFNSNTAGRTIVADAFTNDSRLHFYLWGTALSGQPLKPKEVTVTAIDQYNGKVILDIDCYNWSLTLAACPEAITIPNPYADDSAVEAKIEEIINKAVLIGYGNVDMMFTNNIKFTMSPKGLKKPGKVNLNLVLGTGMFIPDGYDVSAYIYNMTTGELILSDETPPASLSQTIYTHSPSGDPTAAFPFNYTANGKDIKPGTYSFQVEFTKEDENRKYVWNDTIIILPGTTIGGTSTSTKTITIPNLVGIKPNPPANFRVSFNGDEDTLYPDKYSVKFEWDQGTTEAPVNNETNYVLQIAEVPDTYEPGASDTSETIFDAVWSAAADDKKHTFDYLHDIRSNLRFYKDGSLFANNTRVDVYLELGKRYVARLYAENNAGYSDTAAYLTTITPVETGATLKTINRFRVHYYVQGGAWNYGALPGNSDSKLDKIEYWSQSDQTYTVLNPVATATVNNANGVAVPCGATNAPYLYKDPVKWLYWIEELSTGTKYPQDVTTAGVTTYTPDPYADYENLNLYAMYSREGLYEIYNDSDFDIAASYVSGFGKAAGAVSMTETNIASKAAIKDANNKATLTLTLPAQDPSNPNDTTPDWVYDQVALQISYSGFIYVNENQVGADRGVGNEFKIPLGQLETGRIYYCVLKAQYKMTTVSYPFAIYLTD